MTVCIGAFAQRSSAIVLVADKAVTFGSALRPMQSDTGIKKILRIGSSNWSALIAGDPAFALKVIKDIELEVSQPNAGTSLSDMRTYAKKAFEHNWDEEAISKVLRPHLLTKELYIARSATLLPLPDDYFTAVARQLSKFSVKCTILICGFDEQGPHLLSVSEPGHPEIHDLIGVKVIGIGEEMATGRLRWSRYDKKDSLEEVLYEAFDAKAHAELLQGVGYDWDAEIIVKGKRPVPVPGRIARLVEKVWDYATDSPFAKRRSIKPRDDWKEILRRFSHETLGAPRWDRKAGIGRKK